MYKILTFNILSHYYIRTVSSNYEQQQKMKEINGSLWCASDGNFGFTLAKKS
jgi:hypothetical protein